MWLNKYSEKNIPRTVYSFRVHFICSVPWEQISCSLSQVFLDWREGLISETKLLSVMCLKNIKSSVLASKGSLIWMGTKERPFFNTVFCVSVRGYFEANCMYENKYFKSYTPTDPSGTDSLMAYSLCALGLQQSGFCWWINTSVPTLKFTARSDLHSNDFLGVTVKTLEVLLMQHSTGRRLKLFSPCN